MKKKGVCLIIFLDLLNKRNVIHITTMLGKYLMRSPTGEIIFGGETMRFWLRVEYLLFHATNAM